MKRKIILSSQYKKDVKLARRRHLPEEELNDIVLKLANDIPLPIENRDHPLKGDYIGYRECHIQPDWLLIQRKTDNNEFSHLDMFKEQHFKHSPEHLKKYVSRINDNLLRRLLKVMQKGAAMESRETPRRCNVLNM